jgi:hypothetical protein
MAKRAPHPRQDEPAHRPTHRPAIAYPWLLYAVVFVCGADLMALEIVGSRMLAPYFGNSIFVWGSLISVVLAALSLGYWLGGIAADRWPRLSVLATLIAVPGIIIALPFVYPVLNRASRNNMGARWGRTHLILFLVPSVPGSRPLPRLQARRWPRWVRRRRGLYAVSTAGSIVGTLMTAFAHRRPRWRTSSTVWA